jgi:hypothetical protein
MSGLRMEYEDERQGTAPPPAQTELSDNKSRDASRFEISKQVMADRHSRKLDTMGPTPVTH